MHLSNLLKEISFSKMSIITMTHKRSKYRIKDIVNSSVLNEIAVSKCSLQASGIGKVEIQESEEVDEYKKTTFSTRSSTGTQFIVAVTAGTRLMQDGNRHNSNILSEVL